MTIFSILLPIIIMSRFYSYNAKFGPWTNENFLVYQFTAYNIALISRIVDTFPKHLIREKFWQTLSFILIAPINRIHLLLSYFFSHMILISIPFVIFFVLCLLYYPISLLTIIFIIFTFFLIALIFSGIGLLIAVFAISREKFLTVITTFYGILIWFSCISFPYQLYPGFIQVIINLNPLYYIFEFLRLLWIEDNILITFSSYPLRLIIIILCAIFSPVVGIYFFNKIYNKFGIVGY